MPENPLNPENPIHRMSRPTLFIVGALILIAGAVFFYIGRSSDFDVRLEKFRGLFKTAESSHASGDRDAAIAQFEEVVTAAPSTVAATHAKLKIAANLLARNHGNDREIAYRMYKEIAADETVPPKNRAIALNEMAFTMDWIGDHHAMMMYVFNEAPYAQMLEDAGGDMHRATGLIYALSDSIYPTALAKTQIGTMEAQRLLNGDVPKGKTKAQVATEIQALVRDGEKLVGDINYEESYLAHLYLCRAMSLGITNRILNNLDNAEIDAAYRLAIETAKTDWDNVYAQGTLQAAHLMYSVFLNTRYGAERRDEVKQLLSLFGTVDAVKHVHIISYMSDVAKRPDSDFAKQQYKVLAKLSPELRSFMLQTGWTL
jgi:hypothetical protein